jgi:hypothetical protein
MPLPRSNRLEVAEVQDRVCAAAVLRTGLDDFGEPDFHAGLEALLAALAGDLGLEGEGLYAAAVASTAVALASRLHSQAGWTATRCDDRPVETPLFVVGMPRTGTTALHQLLGRDHRFQGLESWLLRSPMPRPPRADWPRYRAYQDRLSEAGATHATLGGIHWVAPDKYDECQLLMAQTMVSNTFGSQRSLPSYDAWYLSQDYGPTFVRLRRNLQLIGSTAPAEKRWLLKNPSHLITLGALLDVFPDATVVVMHRDPVQTIPSTASLLWTIRRSRMTAAPDLDPTLIGARECRIWRIAADRMMDLDARSPGRLIHVQQSDLATRPDEVLGTIYSAASMPFEPRQSAKAGGGAMTRPAETSAHRYRAADFGLTAKGLGAAFARYREHFGFA